MSIIIFVAMILWYIIGNVCGNWEERKWMNKEKGSIGFLSLDFPVAVHICKANMFCILYYNFNLLFFLDQREDRIYIMKLALNLNWPKKLQSCLFSSEINWMIGSGYACGEEQQHVLEISVSLSESQRQGRSFLGRDRSLHILLNLASFSILVLLLKF